MTVKEYSKSFDFYFRSKSDFFEKNQDLLDGAHQKNGLYAEQPLRQKCKICGTALPASEDFCSHGVGYVFCRECNHLNGKHEDTETFVNELYVRESGAEYSKNYIDESFTNRLNAVYKPKVDFLTQHLSFEYNSVLDVGCGAGYFVAALIDKGIEAVGIDVSRTMINFGNQQIGLKFGREDTLEFVSEGDFYERVVHTKAAVISAIGVIEHLREPQLFFDAFSKSDAQYLYYSVPMFSFSAILENSFQDIFPRQLSGGHTHLFTEGSLKRMHDMLGCESVAEWRFGTDMMDLYRSLFVTLAKNNASQKMLEMCESNLAPVIDGLQSVVDRAEFCSEIHCLIGKR